MRRPRGFGPRALILWTMVLVLGSFDSAQDTAEVMLKLRPEGKTPADIQLAIRESGEKLGFLYFTTDWCGWCKKLQKDTFSDREFVEYTETHFVPYYVNAEKNAGPELRTLYKVNAYPTVVIIDGEGRMIDMIIGYKLPEPYLAELKRIFEGEDTLAGLRAAYKENPGDAAVGLRLAGKHFRAYEYEAARSIYEKLRPVVRNGSGRADLLLNLATIYALNKETGKASALLEEGLEEGLFEDNRDRVLYQLGNFRFREGDMTKALAAFRQVPPESRYAQTVRIHVVLALSRMGKSDEARVVLEDLWTTCGEDENRLYTICWYLWDNRVFLADALAWSRRAVEMSEWARPHFINQYAELLLVNGKTEEAFEAERKAVEAAEAKSKPLYRTYLAALKFKSGDRTGAEEILAEIDDTAVDDASTFNAMAWTCLEHGFGLERGLAWAEKAVRISQYLDDNVLSTYAGLLQKSGRTSEAIEALTKAMAITTYEYRRRDYAETIENYRKRE
jgi:thioredoxin-related protein